MERSFYRNGEPDPTIAEIEHAVRLSRVTASESELFLTGRAQRELRQDIDKGVRDIRLRHAYLAGYRMGNSDGLRLTGWIAAAVVGLGLLSLF